MKRKVKIKVSTAENSVLEYAGAGELGAAVEKLGFPRANKENGYRGFMVSGYMGDLIAYSSATVTPEIVEMTNSLAVALKLDGWWVHQRMADFPMIAVMRYKA
jgi:hypothetical protein